MSDLTDNNLGNTSFPESIPPKSQFPFRTAVTVLIVLIALGVAGLLAYRASQTEESSTPSGTSVSGVLGESTIYLSLRPSDNEDIRASVSYTFNVGTGELEQIGSSQSLNAQPHISADGNTVLYVGKSIKDEDLAPTITQLYTVSLETRERKQLTISETHLKRFPRWSPDETQIAFMAQPEHRQDDQQALPADAFSIYLTDLDGNETLLTEGAYPRWTPDGDLVYIKTDGLYMYRMDTDEEELIWESVGGPTNIAMSFGISPDGRHIVWSSPSSKDIAFMDVSSWSPFTSSPTGNFSDILGYWPVFSEDSKYVVMQIAEGDIKDIRSPHALTIISINDFNFERVLDLSGYDLNFTSVTDWKTIK